MSQHTPGPWKWSTQDIGDEDFIIVPAYVKASNGVVVVDVEGGLFSWEGVGISDDERKANARLIAAAPDLLDACKALLGMFEDVGADQTVGCEAARAAIAKAEGRGA